MSAKAAFILELKKADSEVGREDIDIAWIEELELRRIEREEKRLAAEREEKRLAAEEKRLAAEEKRLAAEAEREEKRLAAEREFELEKLRIAKQGIGDGGLESLKVLTESLSISVSPRVRLWSGHDSVSRIKAVTYQQLDEGVKIRFPFADEYTVRLYYIPDSRDVTSRREISDDPSFAEWRSCDPPPVIYVFAYTDDGVTSPPELPSPMTSVVSCGSDSATSSTRGHQQTAFRNALRKRDANKCVVTGLEFVKGTCNVVAAHIFGVERALRSHREKAGICNVYDTDNGFMLSAKWHLGFDQFQWCPNGEGQICVAEDAEDDIYLKYRTDQKYSLAIPAIEYQHKWPSEHVLAARFELFSLRVRQRSEATSDEQKTKD